MMTTVTDPVCGMTLAEPDAALSVEHAGVTYYFCSPACQQRFRENPDRFTSAPPTPDPRD